MLKRRICLVVTLCAFLGITSTTAQAGCGCDHPPAEWAQIMPPFATKGKSMTVFAVDAVFTVGQAYSVLLGDDETVVVAGLDDRLEFTLPGGLDVGPTTVHVTGPGYDHVYDNSLLTVLSKPRRIKNKAGFFHADRYKAAIGHDGTLYLALDMRKVLDARQFMMALFDLPLAYGPEDVVIYNADGVDLTLFTAAVADPTEREWGSYYGWDVEGDSGLVSTYYESKTDDDAQNVSAGMSNLFTYWRHEFHTYYAAHEAGQSHEVDPVNGLHPDGSRHIDHYNLVIAIRGAERDMSAPFDTTLFTPLAPGMREVHLGWVSFDTALPMEPTAINVLMDDADSPFSELLEEIEFVED